MPDMFRVWGKKRGSRRTGSKWLGTVGEALFFGVLFLLGAVSLTALVASQTMRPDANLYQPGFGFWLMLLVLSSFVLLGGGGMIWTVFHVSASAERRFVLAQQASRLDITREASPQAARFPTIPSDANLTNSPGVKLRYRLPVIQSTAWRLILSTVFCLIWNGSAAVLVVLAVSSFVDGQPEWFLTMFTIPFLIIGTGAIIKFVNQMLIHTGIGPTHVEISDHPLRPAHRYSVHLSQAGRMTMKTLTLNLVCEEVATYRQGTDIRTETREVFDRQYFRQLDFFIQPGIPFEHECLIEIPAAAMHSFQSEHNAINWRLAIRGEADAWPSFERSYPIIVYPAQDSDTY